MSVGERDVTELAGPVDQLLFDLGDAFAGLDCRRAGHGAADGFRTRGLALLADGTAHVAGLRGNVRDHSMLFAGVCPP